MESQIKYDVFISFRGPDIRSGFLSHLRKEMRQKRVHFFVDDDGLEGGDEISPALLKAIAESYISLIIFSKDYASSRWCLAELVKITECKARNKQIVIPVFYNIDPSHVRHQKGTYADALAKHEENKENLAKVPNWRSALTMTANLSGFDSSKFRDEAELIEEIVKCLLSNLNLMYQSGSTDLVGIEERIADVKSLLFRGSTTDVRLIGIWGMGGIGKTTIAEAVYNRLCFEYDRCYFMANITEESKNHSMIHLKNKILSKLLEKDDLNIDTPNGVPPYVKGRLVRKKVLLVLDDIIDSKHLENLVGAPRLFGSGSRIIVTTRDKQVLSNKVDNDSIYEAKALSSDEANELFISNAFKESCHDKEWIELSKRVIRYADGNPLALKVLGSFLCRKSKREWESQLQKLKKMPYPEIQNVLRLTYDGLDPEAKEIFLYIACVFKGYELQRIEVVLDACDLSTTIGLKVLQDKALIEAKGPGRSIVWMHDLIQEMGREIVREECVDDPGQRSRLWDPNDIHKVLKNNTGTEAIKSITLNVSEFDELCLDPRVFARMEQLKFLKFTHQNYGHKPILCFPDGLHSLPNGLLHFHWDWYPLKSLPQSFCAENLVELKMTRSRVEKLWDGIQNLQNLKKIDLRHSEYLQELPDFSKASNLEEMELCGCTNLPEVHPSILSLNKLVRLDLFFCEAITSLRGETHLRSLHELYLCGCSRLKEFSVTSENMKILDLTSTAINELPSSIYSLRKLESFFLNYCKSLNYLPENISLLSSLRELSLRGTNIERFPASIKHLSKLKKLYIQDCTRLCHLPELPPSITELYANNCSSLGTVMFTSRDAELLQAYYKIQFQNCGELDERSLSAIAVNAEANMKKFAYENLPRIGSLQVFYHVSRRSQANVIYPGSEVPEWFKYRTTQASVTVDLSSAPSFKFIGFIFCAIIVGPSPSVGSNCITCGFNLETGNGERVTYRLRRHYSFMTSYEKFLSDHVCMWYDDGQLLYDERHDNGIMEEVMASYNPKLSFKFSAESESESDQEMREEIMIKGCGVCPLYITENSNCIDSIELELESTSQSIATEMSVACSKEKETHAPKQDEAELTEKIVNSLPSNVTLMYQSGSTDLVGIDERIADVESLLRQGSRTDVRVIGIWGMGGIGKTTIATAIYNHLCYDYEGCCFMTNITEELEKHGMIYLKNKILSKLLEEDDLHIDTPNEVPFYVKRRLVRKNVLLVLDDINDSEHLQNLVGALHLFGSGSRIIVTTRDKQVLSNKVDNDNIYEAKALSSDEANELFISNAFKDSCHDKEWIELSRRVIQYADGNPLALKVLGSFLCGKSKIEWESQLQKLKKMPHSKIQNALRLTFDGLDQEEKEIFLYIACFLKGYEFQPIISLLDACGFSTKIGLKVLQDKALIIEAKDFGRRSIVWMHDLIQEMGWQIVREECVDDPGQRSRLWDPTDICQVLKENKGTETIKSITLNVSKLDELSLPLGPRVFARMQQLKFSEVIRSNGSNDLRLFRWDSYPLKSLPQSFCAENLVELNMKESRVEKLWDGTQNLENLKKIELSYSEYLRELPDFSKASNLEKVELFGCRNLREVHPSILSLNKLVQLHLGRCQALTSLRGETHLRSLRKLYLNGCSRLEEFSVTSENLEVLNLSSTAINELPSSIDSLRKLETLFLNDCKSLNLNYLSNKLADLTSLKELVITRSIMFDASNLHILFNGLRSLETLQLDECLNLFEIPENISLLSSLSSLYLRGIDIERLPTSIKHLSKLKRLDIRDCMRLCHLPELPPSITDLSANNCSSLETVMFTSRAAEPLQVRFKNCGKLDERSRSAIGVNAHANMKKLAYENLSTELQANAIYPGSEVPEWFKYRTTQASVTVDLSCAPPSKFMGFIFCAILVGSSPSMDDYVIRCESIPETVNGVRVRNYGTVSFGKILSDHVCIWYDEGHLQRDRVFDYETMEEVYNPKLSFKFSAEIESESDQEMREEIMIKGCGVCPLYITENSNFIEQIELELESTS